MAMENKVTSSEKKNYRSVGQSVQQNWLQSNAYIQREWAKAYPRAKQECLFVKVWKGYWFHSYALWFTKKKNETAE